MEGRRFGVGMAAGLLFALAIVAVSGVVAAPMAAPVSSTLGNGSSSYGVRTVTTLTANSGAIFGATTTGTAQVAPSSSNFTSSTGNAATSGSNGQGPSSASFTSSLAGLNQMSSLYRALVFVPIVIAALLGALLYRLYGGAQKEPDQP